MNLILLCKIFLRFVEKYSNNLRYFKRQEKKIVQLCEFNKFEINWREMMKNVMESSSNYGWKYFGQRKLKENLLAIAYQRLHLYDKKH